MGVDRPIDVTTGQRKTITALLEQYLPGTAAWVYGSRANWTSHSQSDLDLVVFAGPGQARQVGDLREASEESDLPFRVDLFVWDEVPESFRQQIEVEHVVLVPAHHAGLEAQVPRVSETWPKVPFENLLAEPVRNGICKPKEFHGRGTKIVNMDELFAHPRLSPVPMKRVELSESEAGRFLVKAGDLLFARRSSVAESAGKCCVVLDVDEPTTFESSIIRARPDFTKADYLYLYYFFSSPLALHQFDTIRRQVAVAGIAGRDLSQLLVPVPPIPQQHTIARFLGRLDDKIELNRHMNETLEAMARALFKSWFVDFDPVRAKMDGRDSGLPRLLADLFPDRLVHSELGQIPEGWKISTIGAEVDALGGATPSTKDPAYWNGGQNNWATPKDLSKLSSRVLLETSRKITDAGVDKIGSGLLPVGSLLLSSRAPIGYLAIAGKPTAVNQDFIAMVCEKRLSNLFVLFWCYQNLDHIKSIADGSTFAEISKKLFRPIPLVVPSKHILSEYDKVARPLFDQIVVNAKELEILIDLRDTLLPDLISGKLCVKGLQTHFAK